MPTRNINSDLKVNADLTLPSLSTYSGSDVTALMIAGADVVGKRDLGTNAFNSTSFLPLAGGTMTGALAMGNQNITGGGSFFANLFSVGNEGKVVSTSTLGLQLQATGSQKPIIFSTNDGGMTERMRVHTDGKVGIAITDPDTELEVGGTIKASTHADAIVIGSPTTVKWKMGVYGANDLLIRDPSNNTKLSILSGGNVGIGTTSPSQKLEVRGSIGIERSNGAATSTIDMEGNFIFNAANGYNYKFRHNGADLVHFDQDGNVGIGTTDPVAKLELVGKQMITTGANASPQTEDYLYIGGDGLAGTDAAIYIGNRGNGSGYGWRMFYEGTGSGNNNKLKFKSENLGSPVDVITMLQDGNVGIGTDSPNALLHVSHATAPTFRLSRTGTGQIWQQSIDSSGRLLINEAASEGGTQYTRLAIDDDGNVGIGTGSPNEKLEVDGNIRLTDYTDDIQFGGTANMLSYNQWQASASGGMIIKNIASASTGHIAFETSLGEKVRILRDGNVGIGTTGPSEKLEVVGDIKASSSANTQVILTSGGGCVMDLLNAQSEAYVRTTSAHDLHFRTTDTNRMVIKAAGNVGIGTTSPTTKFHIDDDASTGAGLLVTGGGGGGPLATFTRDIGATTTVGINGSDGRPQIKFVASSNTFALGVNGSTFEIADNTKLGTNARLSITNTGNVGIGTTNPSSKLQIDQYTVGSNGNQNTFGNVSIFTNSGSDALYLGVKNASYPNRGYAFKITESGVNSNFTIKEHGLSGDRFTIKSGGNVGIGTTSPTDILTINQTADSSGIRINGYDDVTSSYLKMFVDNNGRSRITQNTGGSTGYLFLEAENYLELVAGTFVYTQDEFRIYDAGQLSLGNGADFKIKYDNSTDKLKIHSSSNDGITMDTSGNVGIGTTSPSQKLEVIGNIRAGAGAADNYVKATHSDSSETRMHGYGLYMARSVAYIRPTTDNDKSLYIGTQAHQWSTVSQDASTHAFLTSGSESVRINSSGNVGIGTSSPNALLNVQGDSDPTILINAETGNSANSGKLAFAETDGGAHQAWMKYDGSANRLEIGTADVSQAFVVNRTDGNVGIGTVSPSYKLDVDSGAVNDARIRVKTGDNNAGAYFQARSGYDGFYGLELFYQSTPKWYIGGYGVNRLGFFAGSKTTSTNEKMSLTTAGNLGIGTTSPNQKLDVRGALLVAGDTPNAPVGSTLEVYRNGSTAELAIHQDDASASSTFSQIRFRNGGNDTYIKVPPSSSGLIIDVENKTNAFVIGITGNVGIGTASPSYKLSVSGGDFGVPNGNKVYIGGAIGDSVIGYLGNTSGKLTLNSDGNRDVIIGSGTDTDAVFIKGTNGNVGIGTTSPLYKLQIAGTTYVNGGTLFIDSGQQLLWGNSNQGIKGTNDTSLEFRTGGSTKMLLDNSGNVGIGETAPEVKLEVAGDIMAKDSFVSAGATASQGYTFHDFGTGWGYKGVQSPSRLGMFTASAERVTIDSDGKVGVGTTSPSQKLHVEGNIELQSAWQIGSNTGSYWQRIRTEDATPSTTNAFNFETRNGSGSFIKHVVIRNDGNVGVGNATPAAKLAVEGTISHKVYTVATLPSASPAGQRAFVSDSSYSVSDAHGLVTVGSGSNFCPMYSDGTNWRVG